MTALPDSLVDVPEALRERWPSREYRFADDSSTFHTRDTTTGAEAATLASTDGKWLTLVRRADGGVALGIIWQEPGDGEEEVRGAYLVLDLQGRLELRRLLDGPG